MSAADDAGYVDLRLKSTDIRRISGDELFAEMFAYNLLTPEREVREYFASRPGALSTNVGVIVAANAFHVPTENMFERLLQLGMLQKPQP